MFFSLKKSMYYHIICRMKSVCLKGFCGFFGLLGQGGYWNCNLAHNQSSNTHKYSSSLNINLACHACPQIMTQKGTYDFRFLYKHYWKLKKYYCGSNFIMFTVLWSSCEFKLKFLQLWQRTSTHVNYYQAFR